MPHRLNGMDAHVPVNSVFSCVASLWPAIIRTFYAFGPRLNVIEDPWFTVLYISLILP